MSEHEQNAAFVEGVRAYCKQAGMDLEDTEAMFKLMEKDAFGFGDVANMFIPGAGTVTDTAMGAARTGTNLAMGAARTGANLIGGAARTGANLVGGAARTGLNLATKPFSAAFDTTKSVFGDPLSKPHDGGLWDVVSKGIKGISKGTIFDKNVDPNVGKDVGEDMYTLAKEKFLRAKNSGEDTVRAARMATLGRAGHFKRLQEDFPELKQIIHGPASPGLQMA